MHVLGWEAESIDGLIFVTQSPDYLLPSTACLIHRDLGLSPGCAAFDVGLGCSGYPYGVWLASMMLQSDGMKRVLVLHGETPSRFAEQSDRSVALLFGDAGSATAIESGCAGAGLPRWWFSLNSDGQGYDDLIIRGGGFRDRFPTDRRQSFVHMNGPGIFDFTIKRVPQLVEETLAASGMTEGDVDYYILHQSNRFIMNHLARKMKIPSEKIPLTLGEFGNTGGPSVPLTITMGGLERAADQGLTLLLLGYGVGLSWGSALIDVAPDTFFNHIEISSGNVSPEESR
jgi:3-oxoacyl-[acyl-carrier-protein] synthase-3